jgi:hypothetical protein
MWWSLYSSHYANMTKYILRTIVLAAINAVIKSQSNSVSLGHPCLLAWNQSRPVPLLKGSLMLPILLVP